MTTETTTLTTPQDLSQARLPDPQPGDTISCTREMSWVVVRAGKLQSTLNRRSGRICFFRNLLVRKPKGKKIHGANVSKSGIAVTRDGAHWNIDFSID